MNSRTATYAVGGVYSSRDVEPTQEVPTNSCSAGEQRLTPGMLFGWALYPWRGKLPHRRWQSHQT
jgi:hypothetical protein